MIKFLIRKAFHKSASIDSFEKSFERFSLVERIIFIEDPINLQPFYQEKLIKAFEVIHKSMRFYNSNQLDTLESVESVMKKFIPLMENLPEKIFFELLKAASNFKLNNPEFWKESERVFLLKTSSSFEFSELCDLAIIFYKSDLKNTDLWETLELLLMENTKKIEFSIEKTIQLLNVLIICRVGSDVIRKNLLNHLMSKSQDFNLKEISQILKILIKFKTDHRQYLQQLVNLIEERAFLISPSEACEILISSIMLNLEIKFVEKIENVVIHKFLLLSLSEISNILNTYYKNYIENKRPNPKKIKFISDLEILYCENRKQFEKEEISKDDKLCYEIEIFWVFFKAGLYSGQNSWSDFVNEIKHIETYDVDLFVKEKLGELKEIQS